MHFAELVGGTGAVRSIKCAGFCLNSGAAAAEKDLLHHSGDFCEF